jgi:hypothetical protein
MIPALGQEDVVGGFFEEEMIENQPRSVYCDSIIDQSSARVLRAGKNSNINFH